MQKREPKSPFSFHLCLQGFGRPRPRVVFMHSKAFVHHLQIKFCLNYVHRLSCCQSHYLALSKPEHPHQKYTVISLACLLGISQKVNWRNPFCLQYKFNTLLVEMVGVEPTSRTHSLNQIYNNMSSCDNK